MDLSRLAKGPISCLMAGSPVKVDRQQLQNVMNVAQAEEEAKIFEIGNEAVDFGKADSMRYNILIWVLDEKYDKCIQEMRNFLDNPSDYPNFKEKVERFVSHGIDLIYAIKAKRNFPGIASLTRAKQQELREKFKEHFRELQIVMKKIEKIQVDLRIEDARSTIYVIRALWIAGTAIAILGFFLEVVNGLAITSHVVLNDILDQCVGWLFGLIGL